MEMKKINITKSCDELFHNGSYNYSMPQMNSSQTGECDPRWKAQDDTVLGFGHYFISKSCEHGIRYVDQCNRTETVFDVYNSTTTPNVTDAHKGNNSMSPDDVPSSLLWIIIVIIIIVIIIIAVCGRRFIVKPWKKLECAWCRHTVKNARGDPGGENQDKNKNGDVEKGEGIPLTDIPDVNSVVKHGEHKNGDIMHEEEQPLKNIHYDDQSTPS